MAPAAAEMGLQGRANDGIGSARFLLQQGLRAHYHPGNAISALGGLLLDKGALHWPRVICRTQTFNGGNLFSLDQQNWRDAGEDSRSIDHDGARTALAEAAAEFRSVQCKLVAQNIEEGCIGLCGDLALLAIDKNFHGCSRWLASAGAVPIAGLG